MSLIKYVGADGEQKTVRRAEHHFDAEGVITAYDFEDGGIDRKIQIPMDRVVSVHE